MWQFVVCADNRPWSIFNFTTRKKWPPVTCVTIGKGKGKVGSLLDIPSVGLASLACPWVYWEVSMKPLGSKILRNFLHLSAITTQKFFSQWMSERKPQTHNSLQCCANPSFCEIPCLKIFPYFEWKISLHLIVLTSCSCYISLGIKFKQYLCDKQNYLYSLFYAHTKKEFSQFYTHKMFVNFCPHSLL